MTEKCNKDCKYDPSKVPGCVSMHHCPICLEMQMAGCKHICSCNSCVDFGALLDEAN